jgi:RimJ/RimL family protein N-acetyltransferase
MPGPFETDRLRLRAFEPEDLPALHTYLNYPEMIGRRYLPWRFNPCLFHASRICRRIRSGFHEE